MDTDNIIIISMIINIISISIISIISIIIIISIISIVYYNNKLCDLVFKNMLQLRSVSLCFCQFYIENNIFLRGCVLLQKKVIVPLSSVVFCQKYIDNNFFYWAYVLLHKQVTVLLSSIMFCPVLYR